MTYADFKNGIRDSLRDFVNHDPNTGAVISYVLKDDYSIVPDELKEFNWYVADSGHSIMAVPKSLYVKAKEMNGNLYDYEVTLPVRYVLEKGYSIVNDNGENHVIVDVIYNEEYGAIVDSEYDDFDASIPFPQIIAVDDES